MTSRPFPDQTLPQADLDRLTLRFLTWNGDPPVPQFSHWTSAGTVTIRGVTAGKASGVFWREKDGEERLLGYDDVFVDPVASRIASGKYDIDAGFKLSETVPRDLAAWNNLGG